MRRFLIVASAVLIVGAAGAAEALSPGRYAVKTANFAVSARTFNGNYLSCPKGDRIVPGGGFWHASGSGKPIPDPGAQLANSTPTTDGKGWYATGFNLSFTQALKLEEVALCLPAKRVGHYAVRTKDFTVSPQQFGGNYLSCPKGDRIVTGGAFWHASGSGTPSPDGGFLTNSTPTTDGKGWYATGQNGSGATLDLEEVALCLPSKQVGKYTVKTHNFTVSNQKFGGGKLSCPKGARVVAGGAFWHAKGSGKPVARLGYIANSTPVSRGKGYYATGENYFSIKKAQLEEVVLCL
jgi:hypothetical protein